MSASDTPRLAVLGAGPIGLEAALYARRLHLPVVVYERGRVGDYLRRWGHVRLFSPFGMNTTPLGRAAIRAEQPGHPFPDDNACITGREHLAAYLEPLAGTSLLRDCLRTGTQVLQVGRRGFLKSDCPGAADRGRQPFRLLLRDGSHRERMDEADVILDCTGTYGQHRWMGDGGIPALGETAVETAVAYGLEDVAGEQRAAHAGRRVLVVGAGYSAATTVCALATLAERYPTTRVIWLARVVRRPPLPRIAHDPLPERDRLAERANALAERGDGVVAFHAPAVVEAITRTGPEQPFRVTARCGDAVQTWEVDRIIANVGYTPENRLYQELQVHECYASLGPMALAAALLRQGGGGDCLALGSLGAATLRNPEPNFYILGAKSYGRQSHFLLRTGFAQVCEVFALLTERTGSRGLRGMGR